MMGCQLKKIFEPELLCAGLLEDLGKKLRMSSWWMGFDALICFNEYKEENREVFGLTGYYINVDTYHAIPK